MLELPLKENDDAWFEPPREKGRRMQDAVYCERGGLSNKKRKNLVYKCSCARSLRRGRDGSLYARQTRRPIDPGGVAEGSRWLSAATPPDTMPYLATDPGGVAEGSRWLSAATPPDTMPYRSQSTPEGSQKLAGG